MLFSRVTVTLRRRAAIALRRRAAIGSNLTSALMVRKLRIKTLSLLWAVCQASHAASGKSGNLRPTYSVEVPHEYRRIDIPRVETNLFQKLFGMIGCGKSKDTFPDGATIRYLGQHERYPVFQFQGRGPRRSAFASTSRPGLTRLHYDVPMPITAKITQAFQTGSQQRMIGKLLDTNGRVSDIQREFTFSGLGTTGCAGWWDFWMKRIPSLPWNRGIVPKPREERAEVGNRGMSARKPAVASFDMMYQPPAENLCSRKSKVDAIRTLRTPE